MALNIDQHRRGLEEVPTVIDVNGGLVEDLHMEEVDEKEADTNRRRRTKPRRVTRRGHMKEDEKKAYGHGLTLYRASMRRKIDSLSRDFGFPVKLVPTLQFNKSWTWMSDLPATGVVLFISDCVGPARDPNETKRASIRNYTFDRNRRKVNYLDDPRILAVGAENYRDPPHPKIVQLPIGLESQLMLGGRGKESLEKFIASVGHVIPYEQRQYNVNSDAQLAVYNQPGSGYRDDRASMIEGVERAAVDQWYTRHVPFEVHLQIVSNSRLALCPEGSGIDCHRFYQNYAMGVSCVVRKGVLSPLHSQFPGTVVVDDWENVTMDNVKIWTARTPPERNMELLKATHWINKVLEAAKLQMRVTEDMFE